VQEQVAGMKRARPGKPSQEPGGGAGTTEDRWTVALLDAAATVQVKAVQLGQVTGYQERTDHIRSFLEELAGDMEKLSLYVVSLLFCCLPLPYTMQESILEIHSKPQSLLYL